MSNSCDPMDYKLPGPSVHGILQARILEWVAIFFFRGSSEPKNQTQVSCIEGRFFTNWAMREAPSWPLGWRKWRFTLLTSHVPLFKNLILYMGAYIKAMCSLDVWLKNNNSNFVLENYSSQRESVLFLLPCLDRCIAIFKNFYFILKYSWFTMC